MSLTFVDGSTDRVDHGNTGTDPTVVSWYAWVYPTALTGGRRIFAKLVGATATGFVLGQLAGTANFRTSMDYATTDADARSSVGSLLSTNKWQFLAGTFDGTNAPKLYYGDLTTIVAEVATYDISTAPSGARVTESGASLLVGNQAAAVTPVQGFPGRIAVFNFITGSTLSLADLRSHQFRPRVHTSSKLFTACGYNGTGTQPDWSGNGNAGTVTGATQSDHVPLGPMFGFSPVAVPYVVASGATPKLLMMMGCGS